MCGVVVCVCVCVGVCVCGCVGVGVCARAGGVGGIWSVHGDYCVCCFCSYTNTKYLFIPTHSPPCPVPGD